MGRLLGLELYNFKSYKGSVKLGFGESNFTSIIGPNGSGKSNMMDAISFVLGVRSSHLRSSILRDLIYRGVITGEDSESDEDGSVNNPSTAYVKAFYEKENKTIELMRTISRNGDTNYKIGGKVVSYKDYSSFLESENILIKAKNFLVFQGDVEQIASQSPMDLSRLFEEVSGSIQYKKEYDQLKEKMEQLSKAATESIKNRRRIHGELKTYKEGINKDEEYKSKVAKKKELQTILVLWQLYHLEQKKINIMKNMADTKSKMSVLKDKIHNEERNLQRAKTSIAKEMSIITKKKDKIDYKLKEKEKIASDLKLIKLPQLSTIKRIGNIEKRIESFEKDIERQSSFVERFTNQLKVVTKTKEAFERELKETSMNFDKYRLNDEEKENYQSLNEKYLTSGGSSIEEKIMINENDKQEVGEELNRFEKLIDISKQRINDVLMVELENNQLRASELTTLLNEKNSIHAERLKELKGLQSDIESASNQEYDLNYKLRETLVQIDDLSANQRESMKERKLRENVAMLKRLFPGVKGLVYDLCHPKKDKYSLAVSTCLGRNFDSVIVDNASVAQECIAYLKKQRAGSASFIPLETIDSEIPTLSVSNSQGCILAINAIEYDPRYERAMQYVCSDTIICDTLVIAKRLKWVEGVKAKLVTLEGALIHKAGLMTGGVSKDSNNRWDKEEYQSLMNLKDKLIHQIEEVSQQGRASSMKARDLENNLSVLNTEISNVRIQLTQITRLIDENKIELGYQNRLINEEYSPKMSELNKKKNNLEISISNLQTDKEKLQDIIFAEFTERVGFTVKEYESHSGEIMRKQGKDLQRLQNEILNVENKLQFEQERLFTTKKRSQKAKSDLEKANIELKDLETEEKSLQERIKIIEVEVGSQSEELDELQNIFNAKQRDLNTTDENLNELQMNMQLCKRQKNEFTEDVEKLDLERISILKNCKISNVSIPLLSSTGLADLPLTSLDDEAKNIFNSIDIEYEKLPAKFKESGAFSLKQQLDTEMKEVEEALNVLQPNARAVERFDDAQERFEVVDTETETLKTEERKILAQFLKIKKRRRELFEKAFEHVTNHLDSIYRELTRDPHSSAELSGGNASLTLEDEDEPFNAGIRYHATPPLKRFKDMEYLSGGEKTMAALALLFAINSFQPSPFFVLDEVDAALDVRNVERIAAYIRRHGNPNLQFIVISLKNTMFEKSDALVGVYRQQQENSSKIVTLNLQNYSD
ncbi:hypothetical protein KAFR_0C03200 [Kazachstania africana CBS 2517]|uniref:Structural maintenance of chromosomes protein n=1 Tax=Kazachstania africana (strain ATCC 22294 / BCRC 22015 / CBS 2517 / CECT 1963 / NBRC 1671 / NRRL Y-8276) TaxID=1071382 RepID=H2ASG2_KAZAF|nr:hypothetical protein KAFR_0C03200 [Kazachstania africana CBS 2517]CCF57312.1 hypothetical protein KAFR_0C03200 [Kazachstania africana CBS 2517]